MLIRTDPFREFDRLTEQVLGTRTRHCAAINGTEYISAST